MKLPVMIAMLPTPQQRDYRSPDLPESGNFKRKQEAGFTIDLNSHIAMLPTPGHADGKTGYMGTNRDGKQQNVETVIRNMIPTPHGFSQDGKSNGPSGNEIDRTVGQNTGLRLQPGFVEYLMAFPLNWTSLEQETTESAG
jgi:hypothetical protein